jgi:hypothetical protein
MAKWAELCRAGHQSYVRVRQNPGVGGNKGRVEDAGRSNDDLIRGVAMEGAGQLRGFDAHSWRELNQADTGIRESVLQPIEDRTWQGEAPAFDEFGNFPTRDGADANASVLSRFHDGSMDRGQSGITVDPPNPDVGIQNDHPAASHSAPAPGSVGSMSETGVPRSG